MARRLLAVTVIAVAFLMAGGLQQAQAGGGYRATPDLFYNYYVPPSAGGLGAELYPCPRPTPPYVGWTYITYQGLMPHEFLYKHHRHYWTQHPNGSWTRTVIRWQ